MNNGITRGRKRNLEDCIYRTPVVRIVAVFSAAAVALFALTAIIFLICGGRLITSQLDGATCRYFGLVWGDVPVLGTFRSTDGTGGSVAGDRVKFKDGSVYEGELKLLSFEGEGTFTDAYGNEYIGRFENGKQTGGGFVNYADGGKFAGQFSEGLFEGYGEITYADGSVYKGYFSKGERSGYGEFTYADGSSYRGYFQNDMRHGEGEYHFANGDSYTGSFKNNLMSGFGTYFFASGRVFSGEFVAGVPKID